MNAVSVGFVRFLRYGVKDSLWSLISVESQYAALRGSLEDDAIYMWIDVH